MAKIPETFDMGSEKDVSVEHLYWLLQRMYSDLAESINRKPDLYERTTDGLVKDTFLSNGDMNINTSTLKVEMLTKHVNTTTVTWTTLS